MNPLVFIHNGRPVTDSLMVAEAFGKNHSDVLRDIRNLGSSSDFRLCNFAESSYTNGQGRKMPKYFITEQGFALLAMGYTGSKAMEFKEKYITEFERMRNELNNPSDPQKLIALALIEAQKVLEEKDKQLKIMKPKADFFDAVATSKDAIDIGTAAKVLKLKFGRNRLFEELRNLGVLMNNNQPYQRYIDAGYFRVVEQKYTKPDGSTNISIKTLVYQRGLDFIRRSLEKSN